MMYKNYLRYLLLVLIVGISIGIVGCGDEKKVSQKVGPTVTPKPSVTAEPEPSYEFSFTDEEADRIIAEAYLNMLELPKTYEFDASKDFKSEKSEYVEGGSDVMVYDDKDNLIAVRMYDDESHLYRVFTEYYDSENVNVSGAVYEEGQLVKYYELKELNGAFRVDLEIDNNKIYATYLGKDAKEVRVEINDKQTEGKEK